MNEDDGDIGDERRLFTLAIMVKQAKFKDLHQLNLRFSQDSEESFGPSVKIPHKEFNAILTVSSEEVPTELSDDIPIERFDGPVSARLSRRT